MDSGSPDLGTVIPQELAATHHPQPGGDREADWTPGARVAHPTMGEGTVVGHHRDPHTARIMPRVQFAGEDASLAQGIAPNSLRPAGSTPVDLYRGTQDAVSDTPRRAQ